MYARTNAVIIEFVTAGRRSPALPLINFLAYTDYITLVDSEYV